MTTATTVPIDSNWTPTYARREGTHGPSARLACDLLARDEIAMLDPAVIDQLSAAAAELAMLAGITWQFDSDDSPALLVRCIATVAGRTPDATGPHTERLVDHLRRLDG